MAQPKPRPLSPHLTVYRPQLTSVLSILHRTTGVAIALGTLVVAYWLSALAQGPDAYAEAQDFLGNILIKILLVAWTFALCYHLCNGIRHLMWDMGLGFELKTTYLSGKIMLFAAVLLTLLIWLTALQGH